MLPAEVSLSRISFCTLTDADNQISALIEQAPKIVVLGRREMAVLIEIDLCVSLKNRPAFEFVLFKCAIGVRIAMLKDVFK